MNIRLVVAALLLTLGGLLAAEPMTASGKESGTLVVVVSGTTGAVRLLHGGVVLRERKVAGPYTAAVILAGAEDAVEWEGKPATVLAGGDDPVRVARRALEGRMAPSLFFVKPDGAVEVEKEPSREQGEDGEDGASAATEE